MQRKIFLLLFAVEVFVSAQAQITDTAFAAASYTFLYMADTTKPSDISSETMVLYIGKYMSAYRSYGKVLQDSERKAQVAILEMQFKTGGSFSFPGYKNKGSYEAVYKDFEHTKIYKVEKLIREYLIEENMPVFNWSIMPETKNIQELSCQKATCSFRGRNYTVWFSNQLPFSNGPWKLGGLPGLIIEAADDKNEMVFKFEGYQDVSGKHIPIEFPKLIIKATAKEFQRLQELAVTDPHALMISSSADQNIRFSTYPPISIIQKPSKNPIERTHN